MLTRSGGYLTDQQTQQASPDSLKPPRRQALGMASKRLWIGIGMGVLLGIALNYFAVRPLPLTPGLLVQFIIATWLTTMLHETGHAIAAAFTGFRLLVFAVKPLKFHKNGDSWRLGWLEKTRLGGFIVVVPKNVERLRERMIIVVAAGPIASLLIGCAMIAFAAMAATSLPVWLKTQLNMIGVLSILTALLGALPLTSSFGVSDCQRLRMLLRNGVESERYCSMLLIVAASGGGIRPREWDAGLVERLSNLSDGSPDDRAAQAIRYNWLVDSRRIAEAEEALQQMLTGELPDEIAGIWYLEAAWFEAKYKGDLTSARRWLEAKMPANKRSSGYRCALAKAKAAISALEKDWPAAEAAARETIRECELLSDAGTAIAIRDAVHELLGNTQRSRQPS